VQYRALKIASENQTRWPPGFGSALLYRFESATDPEERLQLGNAMTFCYSEEVPCDWVARLGPEMLARAERAAERPVPGHPDVEADLRERTTHWKPAPPLREGDEGWGIDKSDPAHSVGGLYLRAPADDCPRDLGPALKALEKVEKRVVDLRARAPRAAKDGG
jgi:hypothetical protein